MTRRKDPDGALFPRELEELAATAIGGRPEVGFVLGVVGTRFPEGIWRGFGEVRLPGDDAPGPPGPQTPFELASCTKPFTATLFELWAERRPELLDACLGDVVPPGAPPVAPSLRRVPLRSVLGFTSGLPADNLPPDRRPPYLPDYLPHPHRRYTRDDLFRHAAAPGFTTVPPDTTYTYSSLGYALLAESLPLALGRRDGFPELLAESLLEPLGLAETTMLDAAALERLPVAYDRDGGIVRPGAGGFPAHYGSAGMVTTPTDLLAWLRFQMGLLPGQAASIVLPNLQRPATEIRTHAGLRAGRGWFLKDLETTAGPRPMVLKSGGAEAFTSWIAFVASPRPGILPSPCGVFALSNGHCDIRDLGVAALRLLVEAEARAAVAPGRGTGKGSPRRTDGPPRVCYGLPAIASAAEHAAGGIVKFQHLVPLFPSSPCDFDVLCLVSSRLPAEPLELERTARRRGARLLYNQAGAATPATHGDRWQELNRPLRSLLAAADHVLYQSRFARRLADRFLGPPHGPAEILYNAVDTRFFTPSAADPDPHRLVVLLGGTQYRLYRLRIGLETFAALRRRWPRSHLLVSGRLVWTLDAAAARRTAERMVAELDLEGHVTFTGSYPQAEAPDLLRRAHLLLHPMVHDCCPTTVLEAMACGLPVVYGASGGVPELVGDEAGVAVPIEEDFEHLRPPDPRALADAVEVAADDRRRLGEAGRERAVERFDLRPWLARYAELIHRLSGGR